MKKYNWFGKIVLVAVIAALVLTGCGSSSKNEETTTKENEIVETAAESETEPETTALEETEPEQPAADAAKTDVQADGLWCASLGNNPNNLKVVRSGSDSPVVTDGEHLYFIERTKNYDGTIYRLTQTGLDGGEKKYLANANGGLNYLNGYLYYYVLDDDKARIEKIDLADMTAEVVAEPEDGEVTALLVTEDYIFFYLTHNAFGSVQAIDQKSGEMIPLGGDNRSWGLPLTVVDGTLYALGSTPDGDGYRNVYSVRIDEIASGGKLERDVEKINLNADNSFLFVDDGIYSIYSSGTSGKEYSYFHRAFAQISEGKWDAPDSQKLSDGELDSDLIHMIVSNNLHFLMGNDLYLLVTGYTSDNGYVYYVHVYRFPEMELTKGEVVAEFTGIMSSAGTDLEGKNLYILMKDDNEQETLIGRVAVVSADGTYAEYPLDIAKEQYPACHVYVRSVEDETAYDYDLFTDHIRLMRYHGTESDLTVPTEIDGLPVTEIGDGMYYNKQDLTKVTIPEGITYIGYDAFRGCENLKEVVIPDSVTVIKKKAFAGCTALDTFNFTENLVEIGEEAFRNTGFTEITIPSSLKTISASLFRECSNLTSVTIPEGVETIENYAFYECTIPTVRIPDSVTSIGDEPFSAGHLKTITGSANSMAKEMSERRDYKQYNVEYVEE